MSRKEKILVFCVAAVFAVLLVLMVLTIALNSAASGTLYSTPPFALSSLISGVDTETEAASPEAYIIPAFIGVAPEPEGLGISAGDNVVRELYRLLAPCLADGLAAEPVQETQINWEMAARSSRAVYIRYHSMLPVAVLQCAAAAVCGEEAFTAEAAVLPVREMILLLPDAQYSDCQILLLDADGICWRYLCGGRREYPALETVNTFIDGFGSSFSRCTLGGRGCGSTEPVFLERLRVRNILLTPGTAEQIRDNRMNEFRKFLRQFDFNLDKLSTHEEADGTQVTVEAHGVFRMQDDRLTYTAGTDGGVPLQNFVGYKENYTLLDNLRTACTVLRNLHSYYLGGDGELILTEVSAEEGRLQIVFRYAFDNLLLDGCDPAMVIVMEEGRVVLADIYTIALRSLGDLNTSYLESGVLEKMAAETPYTDVTLTYPVDFSSTSIYPVWTLYREE